MVSQAERKSIKKLLQEGLSGSKIAKQLGIRKQTVLSEIRFLTKKPKQKQKITVKGKGSQTRARKSRRDRDNEKNIKAIKNYQHPKARFYATISTEKKYSYPSGSNRKTDNQTYAITDKEDFDKATDKLIDLYDLGLEPVISYVDLQTATGKSRKVSESYVLKRLEQNAY